MKNEVTFPEKATRLKGENTKGGRELKKRLDFSVGRRVQRPGRGNPSSLIRSEAISLRKEKVELSTPRRTSFLKQQWCYEGISCIAKVATEQKKAV